MEEICRFCTLNCNTLENIFDERELTDNEPLIGMLECCTNCEIIESDTLPQNICGPCTSAAENAFEFKLRCEKSQKYFRELLSEYKQPKIKYEIEEVCRFCTINCTTLENIFIKREQTDNEPLIIVMLEYCTDCEIRESDSLPQNICGPCISAAKNAFEFKMKCEQSQNYLRELLSDRDQKPDIEELITGDWCPTESTLDDVHLKTEQDKTVGEDNFSGSEENSRAEASVDDDYSKETEGSSSEEETKETKKESTVMKTNGTKSHICHHCNSRFSWKSQLIRHSLAHTDERPFECPHCPLRFKTNKVLKAHIRIHTGECPYKCHLCSAKFKRIDERNKHVLSHTGERPYKCSHCSKGFKSRSILNKHIRTHSDQKEHKCPHCPKEFNIKYYLDKHIRVHTGERPYKCPQCPKTFTRSEVLKTQKNAHNAKFE
ncbi:zinc finger protein 260-like [Drosophila innubila]|uniref:zinc finger protein 260-like n=1 Tax=Drosophila innubila TaxID=198719 RepID=UPI00148E100E|nr:zinc finger protein 260-like [Drosophila innubila]